MTNSYHCNPCLSPGETIRTTKCSEDDTEFLRITFNLIIDDMQLAGLLRLLQWRKRRVVLTQELWTKKRSEKKETAGKWRWSPWMILLRSQLNESTVYNPGLFICLSWGIWFVILWKLEKAMKSSQSLWTNSVSNFNLPVTTSQPVIPGFETFSRCRHNHYERTASQTLTVQWQHSNQ